MGNVWDVVLTLLLIAAVGGALLLHLRRRRRGGCGCGCEGCTGACQRPGTKVSKQK